MQIGGQIQTFATNPRNWAKGVWGFGKMLVEPVTDVAVTGSKSISEQNTATNLYNQSKDLADQAAKIVKTDRPQAEALLRQSQALTEEANKFAQGEATKKIMGADGKLTGTEIFAKSALAGLTVGSFLPVGTVVKGTGVLANVSTKVPATLQASKTVAVGNIITRGLGLGDIYQVGKVGAQKGFGKIMEQTVYGQALKATPQALTYAGLGELADDDGVNNYWGSVGTNAIGAFGVTLGLGYGAKVLGSVAQAGVSDISKIVNKTGAGAVTDLAGALPMPPAPVKPVPEPQKLLPLPQEAIQATTIIDGKVVNLPPSAYTQPVLDRNVFEPKAQVIGTTTGEPLPNFFEKLGAFDPQETIPMVDITETIKGNNIDFNPDSVMSINATRKTIDDLALLTGNEVGGKKLKINTEDPKYKEVYNNMIKPLVDRINEVDKPLEFDDFFREYNRMIGKFKDKSFASVDLTFKLDKEIYGGKLELKRQEIEKVWQKWKKTNGENPEEFMQTKTYQSLEKERMDIVREIKNNPKVKKLDLEADKLSEEIDKFKKNYELSKVPVEDVEMEVQKIYSELENAGMNIVPEQVRLTPNIQAVEKVPGEYIPTKEGKAPPFKQWLEIQSGYIDVTKAQVQGEFSNSGLELSTKEIKNILKNWDTFDGDIVNQYNILDLEDRIDIVEDDYTLDIKDQNYIPIDEYKLSDYVEKFLTKEQSKQYSELFNKVYKTKEEAKNGLKNLLEFEMQNSDAFKKAKQEIIKIENKENIKFFKNLYKEEKDSIIEDNNNFLLQKQLAEGQTQLPFQVEKVPVEDVEMEVQKIYSELENAGMNIVPEQVRLTPNIQAVDEKLAKGEIPTPEEFDKGMKEYVNSTGKTEVIDGVQEELRNPMRKSTYVEKLKKENPDLNIESVQYEAAIVKDLEEKAINLIETNFDEAGKIARNITKSSSPEQVKIAELYMEKLRELGKNDELAQILHRFGKASSQAGQWNGILRPNKIGSPEYAIKEAQKTRMDKLKPQIDKEVAKVKQEMSSVVIDQTVIFDILDNITCR